MHIDSFRCDRCSRILPITPCTMMSGDTLEIQCSCGQHTHLAISKSESEIIYINGQMIIR